MWSWFQSSSSFRAVISVAAMSPQRDPLTGRPVNPYTRHAGYLDGTADLLAQVGNNEPVVTAMARQGCTASYGITTQATVLSIESESPDPAQAEKTARCVLDALRQDLNRRQVGVDAPSRITLELLEPPRATQPDPKTRLRNPLLSTVAGAVLTLLAAFVVEGMRSTARGIGGTAPNDMGATLGSGPGDLTGIATGYLVLLFLVPARLVVSGVPFNLTPAMVIGYLCLLWWSAAQLTPTLGSARAFQPVRTTVWLFWGALLVSFMAGAMSYLPWEIARRSDRQLVTFLASVGIAAILADGILDWGALERLAYRMVNLAAFVAVIGIMQFTLHVDITEFVQIPGTRAVFPLNFIASRSQFSRPSGTAIHPIEFGVVMATILPLAIHFALTNTRDRRAFLRWAPTLVIAVGMLMSLSRSAILATAFSALVIWSGMNRRQRVASLLIVPVFLAGVRLLVPGLVGTLGSLFTHFNDDPSIQGRTQDYEPGLQHWLQSPWVGNGLGTSTQLLDNQYLGALIETGILGLACLITLLISGVLCARGARLRTADDYLRSLCNALAAAAMVPFVAFITFDAFAFPMCTGLTFTTLGLCGAAWRLSRTPRSAPDRVSTRTHLRQLTTSRSIG
jgi:hypothetical protein